MAGAAVRIYNPLPHVLDEFVDRLLGCIEFAGMSAVDLEAPNGEVGRNLVAKARAFGGHTASAIKHAQSGGPNIVAWPLFGWWDMTLWRDRNHRSFVLMHDPKPLARQNGLSGRAAVLSSRLSGPQWPHLVTMSPEAQEVATAYFAAERIHLVPHPMNKPKPGVRPGGRKVLVIGQYKPARDLAVMKTMAPMLAAAGWNAVVAGRGWPSIPGWNVMSRFMSPEEFDALLRSADVVLVPYKYYFQSGVAIRALEVGVPVVGRSSGFLTSVLGPNFAGAVRDWDDPASWLAAVEAATHGRSAQIAAATAYFRRGIDEWRALLEQPTCSPSKGP